MKSSLAADILSSRPEKGPLIINIIGAGGKTSLMFYLAEWFRLEMMSVLVTTTTKIYIPKDKECNFLFIGSLEEAESHCAAGKIICAAPAKKEDKLIGYNPEQISLLAQSQNFPDVILVEADGAARKPLKKHADYEPSIILNAHLTIIVAGMSSYNKPLNGETIHRLKEDEKSCFGKLDYVDAAVIASILKSNLLQLSNKRKNDHPGRDIIVLNQSDEEVDNIGAKIAEFFPSSQEMYQMSLQPFLEDGMHSVERVFQEKLVGTCRLAALVLAAGRSQRMGRNKLLLPWQDSTIIETVVKTVQKVQLEPLLVVLGSYADEIKDVLSESLTVVCNDEYQTGQSSSLRCGIEAIERLEVDGCLCMLGDQPLVESETLIKIIITFIKEKPDILIPLNDGKRGNPVVLSMKVFSEVKKIKGDVGARVLFSEPALDIREIETGCRGITTDIDTYEEYNKLFTHC